MATRNTKNTRAVNKTATNKQNSEVEVATKQVASENIASENVIQEGSYTIDIPEGNVVPVYQDNTGTTSSTTHSETQPTLDMNALLNMVGQLQQTVMDLQSQLKKKEEETQKASAEAVSMPTQVESDPVKEIHNPNNSYNSYESTQESDTQRILSYLTNKKSDKEITIIHNRERMGGLSTAIRLNGLSIDFHTLGEQRVLSWQQFEECVSKYKKFFDKRIILVAPEYKDIAERYNVPVWESSTNNVITRNDLAHLGDMTIDALEKFYNSLCKEDQAFLCSYWLGKCYEKEPRYYDRYKVELLNRLSDGAFATLLTAMNYDFMKDVNTTETTRIM